MAEQSCANAIGVCRQTSDSLNVFFSWASLISSSTANFAIPLLIYIFLKNRKSDDIIMHLHPEMSRHTLNTDDPSTMGTDSQDGLDEVSVEMLEEDAKLMTVKVDLAEITATLRDAATSRSGGKRGIGGSSSKGDSMLGSRFIGSKFSVGGNGRRGSVLASMLPEHPPTGLMGNILARAASRNLSDKGSGHRRKSFVDLQMAADLGLSQSNMASMSNIAATNDSSYGGGAMSDLSSIGVGKPATIAEPVQPVTPFPSPPVVSADWKPFSASAREDEDSIKSSGSFSRSSPLHTIMSTSELEVDSDEDAQSNSNATSASVSSTDVASTSGVSQPNKDATETATKTPEAQETQRVASAVYLPRSMKRTINSRAPKEETPATPAAGDAKTSSATPTPAPAAPEPITERDLLPPGIGSLSDLGKPAIALTLTPFDSDTPTDQIGLDGKVRKPPQPPKEPKETSEISAPVSGPASSGASAVTPKGAKQKNASTNQDAGVQQKAKTATKTNHVDQDKANGSPEVSKKGSVQPAPLSQSRSPSAVVSTKPPLAKEANATSKKKEIENGELPPLPTKPSDRGRSPGGGADAPTPDTKQNASNQPVAQPTASQPPYDRPRSRERRSSLERRLSLEQRRSSLPNSGERRSSLPRAGQAGYAGTGPTPPADNRGDIRTIQRRSSKDASGLPLINVDFSGADLDLASSPSSSSPSSSRPAMSMHSSTPTSTTALLPNQGDGPRDGMPPPPPRPSKVPSVAGFYLDPYYRNRLRELQEANPDYPRPDLDGLDALDQVLPEGVKAFQAIPEQLLILHFHPFYWYWNRIVGLFSCFRCCLRLRRGKRVAASLQHGLLTPAPNDADNHAGGKRVEIEPQWVALTALLITLFTTVGAIIWNVVIAVRN